MTEQQQHLQQVLEQQKQLANEVQELQNQMSTKKDLFMKLQGIIEYLQQVGVTLPTPEETEVSETTEETAE